MANLKVLVDWDNNNTFDNTFDDITEDVKSATWFLGMRQPGQLLADESTAQIVLDNTAGRYTPENASSPLFGKMLPNRRLKIRWTDGLTDYDLWSGFIEFPSVDFQIGETSITEATITGTGVKRRLDAVTFSEKWENVTGDVIIAEVLQIAGGSAGGAVWLLGVSTASEIGQTTVLGTPAQLYDLETGVYTIPYYSVADDSAYGIIGEVTSAEQGRFFYDRSGLATWWNQNHLAQEVVAKAAVNTLTGDFRVRGREYVYGADIANVIEVGASPTKTEAAETLWAYDGDPLPIAAGETIAIKVRLRKSSGQFASAGSLTASPTFSSGTGTVNVIEEGGNANVEISSVAGATLSALTLSGSPETKQNSFTVTRLDTGSIGLYGKREMRISLGPVAEYDRAEVLARETLRRYVDPFGAIRTLIYQRAFDGVDNAHQLDWTIGDALDITAPDLGQSARYIVMGEEHTVDRRLNVHQTTYHLEPGRTSQIYWAIGGVGTSELGERTWLA